MPPQRPLSEEMVTMTFFFTSTPTVSRENHISFKHLKLMYFINHVKKKKRFWTHTWDVAKKCCERLPDATGIFCSNLNTSELWCSNHLHGLCNLLDVLHTFHPISYYMKQNCMRKSSYIFNLMLTTYIIMKDHADKVLTNLSWYGSCPEGSCQLTVIWEMFGIRLRIRKEKWCDVNELIHAKLISTIISMTRNNIK